MDLGLKKHVEKRLSGINLFGVQHVNNLLEYNTVLCEGKEIDERVLTYATALHNIGIKHWLEYKTDLLTTSLNLAKSFLESSLGDKRERQEILYAISSSALPSKPETMEAKILHDSNLLDNIGTQGVVKDSVRAFHEGTSPEKIIKPKARLIGNAFCLAQARELAREKIRAYKEFASGMEA